MTGVFLLTRTSATSYRKSIGCKADAFPLQKKGENMWIALAFGAAVTSGVAVIFQKKGTSGNNIIQISAVHLLALFVTVLLVTVMKGGLTQFLSVPAQSWWLAAASGLVQAGSWVAYFAAMRKANVSFLMVLDKTGIIVTMLLAAIFLQENITIVMILGSVLVLTGTALMGNICNLSKLLNHENRWLLWGIVSPALQAVSNILAKLDTSAVDTTVTTTIRMFVVAVCLCLLAYGKEGPFQRLQDLGGTRIAMLLLGGVILGASYLLMYKAFSIGTASAVTAIVRSNFLVTTVLARIFFKEKLSRRGILGFITVCIGVGLFLF